MALRAAQMASNPRNTCTRATLILLGRVLNLNCQPDISAMTLLMGSTDRWSTLQRAPLLVCSKKSYGLFWHVQSSSELGSWQCNVSPRLSTALICCQVPSQLAEQWTLLSPCSPLTVSPWLHSLPPLAVHSGPGAVQGPGQVAGSLMQLVSTDGDCFCMVWLHDRWRPFHPSLVWCWALGLVHIHG